MPSRNAARRVSLAARPARRPVLHLFYPRFTRGSRPEAELFRRRPDLPQLTFAESKAVPRQAELTRQICLENAGIICIQSNRHACIEQPPHRVRFARIY